MDSHMFGVFTGILSYSKLFVYDVYVVVWLTLILCALRPFLSLTQCNRPLYHNQPD